jgi:hypothetical protein
MPPETVTQDDAHELPDPPRQPRGRAHKAGRWVLVMVVMLSLVVGGVVVTAVGQRLKAPDWLRARIEARIERSLGGMQIEFGDVSFVINKGWRPRVRLRDVRLLDGDGQPVAQLAEAQAALAMRPLLRGRLQPKQIVLLGAIATLRRDREGKVALSVGGGAAPLNQAANLPQLIEQWDQLFLKPQLAALVSVQVEALTLLYEDAQKGRAWTLDGGTIQLDRSGDDLDLTAGFSLLSGHDYAAKIEVNYSSRIGDARAEFGMLVEDIAAQDIAAQNVALAWLDVLRAPISGALRGGIKSDGSLMPLSATLQIGAGVLQPRDQTRPIPFNGARSYFTFEPDSQLLTFDELSVSSDWGSGVAEGRAWLGGIQAGKLNDLTGQFTLTNLSFNPDGVYPEPLDLDGVAADFRLELDPFRLTLGQMHIADGDSNLLVAGTLDAASDGWHLSLDGQVDRFATDRLMALWPNGVVKKPRKWVRENLLGGTAYDIGFSVRSDLERKPVIQAGFGFRDATIRFVKTLPPITGAAGHASLSGGRFVVTATKGQVIADQGGAVDVAGTSFIIPDVTIKKAAPGVVRLNGQGSVTAVLSLLNRPPLQVMKDTPLPVDVADGQAQLTGTLSLPLKDKVQIDEMEFHFQGKVVDVSSDLLVPGFSLVAPVMRVTGDQSHLLLTGKGLIGPVPVEVTWHRPIGKGVGKESKLTGEIELSQLVVDTFGIGLPNGSVSGVGTGQFTLDLAPGKAPALSLTSDLRGVGLRLAPLGWSKSEESVGVLELAGTLGEQTKIDHLVVKALGLSAIGKVLNRPGGGLDRATFSSVTIGEWLDVEFEITGRGKNEPPQLHIQGGTLDMRRADFGVSQGDGATQTGPLQVFLDRLQVTDTIALDNFSGQFDTNGGLGGPFRGSLNGQTELSGTLEPRGDRSAVRVDSADAGGVFRAAGLLTQAQGGDFKLSLLPVADVPGDYDGTLWVTNTRVKDAPAIAALLNAISVVGLIDEMGGQGIVFNEVEAKFRLGPSQFVLYESSAVGPSIGLSMDGLYDVSRGVLDMQGVISPVYLLNALGSILTRKGEGLIGFSYKLTGPAASPNVQVNPLSGLAPGILRDLFRGTPPPVPEGSNLPSLRPPQAEKEPISNPADMR